MSKLLLVHALGGARLHVISCFLTCTELQIAGRSSAFSPGEVHARPSAETADLALLASWYKVRRKSGESDVRTQQGFPAGFTVGEWGGGGASNTRLTLKAIKTKREQMYQTDEDVKRVVGDKSQRLCPGAVTSSRHPPLA